MTGFARRGGDTALLALACLLSCTEHGIVGITASKSVDKDASVASSDAQARPDAPAPTHVDGSTPHLTVIDDCLPVNPANLDAATAELLIDGTGDTSAIRLLYPYDGTVYPQGIPGPVLMWDGPASDVVYVRLHSQAFDYRGCLKPTGPNLLELPSGIWDLAAASTSGATDPFTLDLKLLSGETVHGPISEQLVIAGGALKGSVYYMTTSSPALVGGVMRVRAGRPAEAFLAPPSCAGCHSVSANGLRLVAFASGGGNSFTVSASSLTPLLTPTPGGEFAGIYPDGSVYVASAHPTGGGGPRSYVGGLTDAGLYDTTTGALVGDSGIPTGACMPSFSVDGTELAFTDLGAASAGHTLALMQFSIANRVATGYQSIYSTTSKYVGWPAFLPDGQALVFTQGDAADFSGGAVGLVPVLVGPSTDLFIADTSTHSATFLSQAMGFRTAVDQETAQTYLPGGATDLHQNYYPNVSPVAAGGYAWVFFDSARSYGNQGIHRAIWGTAISLSPDGTYTTDPSHPAFYLPGQNPSTPNFRPVAVPDP